MLTILNDPLLDDPTGQLSIALPPVLLKKYEERVKEEDLNLANLEDLVRYGG